MTNIIFPNTRLRRNRNFKWSRAVNREHNPLPQNLILPLFVCEDEASGEIRTMPGIKRHSLAELKYLVPEITTLGIQAVMLFPYVMPALKTSNGAEALNPDNIIYRAIKLIKDISPQLGVIVDVALDPFTSHGHDGVIDKNGYVLNDGTVEILCNQALYIAKAGADAVAPSDMMDGRVLSIRKTLESHGYYNMQIISYAAKFASNLYAPFRDGVGSKGALISDKKSYQMDYANSDEAMAEVKMDIAEGADVVIIKPGMTYLDIVYRASSKFEIPVWAYHVSGEYAMWKIAAAHGIIDADGALLELITGAMRAGARAVITYAALEAAKLLNYQ